MEVDANHMKRVALVVRGAMLGLVHSWRRHGQVKLSLLTFIILVVPIYLYLLWRDGRRAVKVHDNRREK
jgi:hypothetical protein